MDFLWLQNSAKKQFLMNIFDISSLSTPSISTETIISNSSSSSSTITTLTSTNPCNENSFTHKLINSIRQKNIANDNGFSERNVKNGSNEQHYQQQQQPSLPNTATSTNNIMAIGNIANLDIENRGRIHTYECDYNYTTATTITSNNTNNKDYNNFNENIYKNINKNNSNADNVKNYKYNYNKKNNNNNNDNSNELNYEYNSNRKNIDFRDDGGGRGGDDGDGDADVGKRTSHPRANITATVAKSESHIQNCIRHAKLNATQWWKNLVIVVCFLFICSSSLPICGASKHEASNCTFPQRWEGSWFLSGNQQPIYIKGNILSFRGKCMASDGDKFLIVDDKGCHRCLVIYEKHKNVLQYKESECEGDNMFMDQSNPAAMSIQQMRSTILKSDHKGGAHPNIRLLSSSDQFTMRSNDDNKDNYYCKGRETLQNLCEQIAGDALLYSLFKENAEPVKCPLRGPFTFTYNRGHGECKNPVSNIESCTEDSRLLLNLQACPDVAGTESTVEELTCLATWKDGNSRYLVGLVSHHHAVSNEERYRCFVYEKILSSEALQIMAEQSISRDSQRRTCLDIELFIKAVNQMYETTKDAEYKLAQSGDATCNGLDSAEVGSRIMTLRRTPLAERCDFPTWFKGPKHWHSLIGNNQYVYHQSDGSLHVLKSSGHMETRALCEQINKQTATESQVIVHQTTGCQSGFMCMIFYRRDTHLADVQMGTPAVRLEDACALDHFDVSKLPFITLVATTVDPQECPLNGLYSLRGAIGPPYITSRHKRNHNKGLHHHHETPHKRYAALSFRNSEEFTNLDWHMRSRITPFRNRRDIRVERLSNVANAKKNKDLDERHETDDNDNNKDAISPAIGIGSDTSSTSVATTMERTKRDTPECVINYNSARQLLVGCSQSNVIEVRPHCSDDGDEVYNCQGSWTENTTTFIVATHSGSQHGVCISYQPLDATTVRLFVGDSCYRSTSLPVTDHHLAANLTIIGKCTDVSSATITAVNWTVFSITSVFILIVRKR